MPINPILKLWYKIFNKSEYQNIKYQTNLKDKIKYYNSEIYNQIIEIQKKIENNNNLTFLHSGHLGDIIYSLPVIKEISKTHVCNLCIQIDKPMELKYFKHPSGNKYLDKRIVEMLIPLLKNQKYLNNIEIYTKQKIDIDLDLFRKIPINIQFYSPRWFFQLTGVHVNLEKPYLNVESHQNLLNKIVILRTFRARNYFINYKFLNKYDDLLFIGMKDEFEDIKKQVQNIKFHDCKNFLEMAQIIKSSKFFIGNQGIGYAIAEALKVPRLLEANPDFPVIFPIGPNAFDFYHQVHFEKFFEELNKS
tara:strand:+ start:168 stop:1082 length:915 start_codon:yes stop_codon:yes gene_type:complete